ncbi:hypothetical protein ECTW09195_1891, partial [Escherichia coli TW09195]
MVFDHFIF